jgi:serine/threonine-protein kinase RsbT
VGSYKLFANDRLAVIDACRDGRQAAEYLGASCAGGTLVATVVSELARNLICHGGGGDLTIEIVDGAIVVETLDRGPGIVDIPAALIPGYSTNGGAGNGLSGIARVALCLSIENLAPSGLRVRAVLAGPPLGLSVPPCSAAA